MDEPQQCYESDDDAVFDTSKPLPDIAPSFDDKEELDLLYNLQHASPGDVIPNDNPGLCNVDHIPNTVKYSANLLQNHFMFLTITNVMKGTVRFVILFHFTFVYIQTIWKQDQNSEKVVFI